VHERVRPSQARWKTRYAAAAGFATTAIAVGLAFVPPEGISSPAAHVSKVAGQALLLLAVGVAFYAVYRRKGRPPTKAAAS
jgi:hypothetical protein